ncbi:hypothetical protein B0T24DRAFT_18899 [Lasiosphaeria ovina]|uniref:Uncharacterized protein n=1 Tax=Lasiosphaeria ovina TaxID=92902 RepID=A0AAE0NJK3_9PEZI|nr:hypothetical protein B0T24DRAFT_18899 [Lasiosphaeria ovina]
MPAHISDTRDGSAASENAGRKWERQFCPQGEGSNGDQSAEFGRVLLGSPWVPSRYPAPHQMALEISSPSAGTDKGVGGSIRLLGPRGYWPKSGDSPAIDACFAPLQAAHIGKNAMHFTVANRVQILAVYLIRPGLRSQAAPCHVGAPCRSPPSHYRPSCCGWVLIHQETIPPIIEFSLPDKEADGSLSGSIVEGADLAHKTYLSVFKKAMDEVLAPFNMSVIDVTETENHHPGCDTVLKYKAPGQERSGNTKDFSTSTKQIQFISPLILTHFAYREPPGRAYFLETGILFLAFSRVPTSPWSLSPK